MMFLSVKMVIMPNGGNDYMFIVGKQSPVGLGKIKKIQKNSWDSGYIVFLDTGAEVDVISDKLIVS
jgi:hypothetical protein